MKLLSFVLLIMLCIRNQKQEGVNTYIEIFDEPQKIHFKSGLNGASCNNKSSILLDIPKECKGVIYSITALNRTDYNSYNKELLKRVEGLKKDIKIPEIGGYLTPTGNRKDFNLYIMKDFDNVENFKNCGYFNYGKKQINTKSKIGYIKIEDGVDENIYIGIENNKSLKNLRLVIEAIAVL